MKDPVQSIQKQIADSRKRELELQAKLAALPADAGPETLTLYQNLLAKEKKFQERMTLALAPPPERKKNLPVVRITLVALALAYLVYLLFQ